MSVTPGLDDYHEPLARVHAQQCVVGGRQVAHTTRGCHSVTLKEGCGEVVDAGVDQFDHCDIERAVTKR